MPDLLPQDPVEAIFLTFLLSYLVFLTGVHAGRLHRALNDRRTQQQIIDIQNMIDAHDRMMAEAEEASRARGA